MPEHWIHLLRGFLAGDQNAQVHRLPMLLSAPAVDYSGAITACPADLEGFRTENFHSIGQCPLVHPVMTLAEAPVLTAEYRNLNLGKDLLDLVRPVNGLNTGVIALILHAPSVKLGCNNHGNALGRFTVRGTSE